ncbi:MAG: 50S ribosomal protein L33 [candidate division WOR-3 bacterium]
MRIALTLACSECRNRNYTATKNKKRQERLELRKYCRFCKKHTIHKEVK